MFFAIFKEVYLSNHYLYNLLLYKHWLWRRSVSFHVVRCFSTTLHISFHFIRSFGLFLAWFVSQKAFIFETLIQFLTTSLNIWHHLFPHADLCIQGCPDLKFMDRNQNLHVYPIFTGKLIYYCIILTFTLSLQESKR